MASEYTTEGIAEYVLTLFPATFTGICLDVGAFDPFYISNSWIFERMGWDTYCIEPNPHCIPRLKQYRKNVLEYACGSENKDDVDLFVFNPNLYLTEKNLGRPPTEQEIYLGEAAGTGLIDHCQNLVTGEWHKGIFSGTVKVKVRTLDWLMENEIKQDHIDYLSIDVERNEMEVLKGISLEIWKPKLIVIENLDEDLEQKNYLTERNYIQVYRMVFNDIYLHKDQYTLVKELESKKK